MLLTDLHFLELAQGPQPHIENGFGLPVGELERGDQFGLGFVLGADDPDHFVEIQIDGEIAFQHFQPIGDARQPVAAAPTEHVAAMIEERGQRLAQTHHAGGNALLENVQIQRKARFQIRLPEQLLHQDFGLDGAALGHQYDADVLSGFVAHIIERGELLLLDQLRDALDQFRLLHLIGHLIDDDLIGAARAFLAAPRARALETRRVRCDRLPESKRGHRQ